MKFPVHFFSWLLACLVLVCAPGCAPVAEPPPDCQSLQVTCVGLVTDLTGVQDFGLNEQIWQVLEELRAEGIVAQRIESVDRLDYRKNLAFFGDQGYDFVVVSGYDLAQIVLEKYGDYPDVDFLLVGQAPPEEDFPPNVAWIIFPEEQAGRWAGALAAHFSESRLVSGIFAHPEMPSVAAYARGFEAGVQAVNDADLLETVDASQELADVTEEPSDATETPVDATETPVDETSDATETPVDETEEPVEEIVLAPVTARLVFYDAEGDFGASLSDPDWGAGQARALEQDGADVLFAYGGGTATSALEQASSWIIAVEVDLARRFPYLGSRVITSIVYDVSSLAEIIRAGSLAYPVYTAEYQVIWGSTPAPEVIANLEAGAE